MPIKETEYIKAVVEWVSKNLGQQIDWVLKSIEDHNKRIVVLENETMIYRRCIRNPKITVWIIGVLYYYAVDSDFKWVSNAITLVIKALVW